MCIELLLDYVFEDYPGLNLPKQFIFFQEDRFQKQWMRGSINISDISVDSCWVGGR